MWYELHLVAAAGPALDCVTATDARGFYAHCGLALPGQLHGSML